MYIFNVQFFLHICQCDFGGYKDFTVFIHFTPIYFTLI